jgi:hypothetical protein
VSKASGAVNSYEQVINSFLRLIWRCAEWAFIACKIVVPAPAMEPEGQQASAFSGS